ncbi:unnamed protein product, partial [Amoebophrya sp. A25]
QLSDDLLDQLGAAFGRSMPGLFFLRFPDLICVQRPRPAVRRIFGFRIAKPVDWPERKQRMLTNGGIEDQDGSREGIHHHDHEGGEEGDGRSETTATRAAGTSSSSTKTCGTTTSLSTTSHPPGSRTSLEEDPRRVVVDHPSPATPSSSTSSSTHSRDTCVGIIEKRRALDKGREAAIKPAIASTMFSSIFRVQPTVWARHYWRMCAEMQHEQNKNSNGPQVVVDAKHNDTSHTVLTPHLHLPPQHQLMNFPTTTSSFASTPLRLHIEAMNSLAHQEAFARAAQRVGEVYFQGSVAKWTGDVVFCGVGSRDKRKRGHQGNSAGIKRNEVEAIEDIAPDRRQGQGLDGRTREVGSSSSYLPTALPFVKMVHHLQDHIPMKDTNNRPAASTPRPPPRTASGAPAPAPYFYSNDDTSILRTCHQPEVGPSYQLCHQRIEEVPGPKNWSHLEPFWLARERAIGYWEEALPSYPPPFKACPVRLLSPLDFVPGEDYLEMAEANENDLLERRSRSRSRSSLGSSSLPDDDLQMRNRKDCESSTGTSKRKRRINRSGCMEMSEDQDEAEPCVAKDAHSTTSRVFDPSKKIPYSKLPSMRQGHKVFPVVNCKDPSIRTGPLLEADDAADRSRDHMMNVKPRKKRRINAEQVLDVELEVLREGGEDHQPRRMQEQQGGSSSSSSSSAHAQRQHDQLPLQLEPRPPPYSSAENQSCLLMTNLEKATYVLRERVRFKHQSLNINPCAGPWKEGFKSWISPALAKLKREGVRRHLPDDSEEDAYTVDSEDASRELSNIDYCRRRKNAVYVVTSSSDDECCSELLEGEYLPDENFVGLPDQEDQDDDAGDVDIGEAEQINVGHQQDHVSIGGHQQQEEEDRGQDDRKGDEDLPHEHHVEDVVDHDGQEEDVDDDDEVLVVQGGNDQQGDEDDPQAGEHDNIIEDNDEKYYMEIEEEEHFIPEMIEDPFVENDVDVDVEEECM